MKKKKKKKNPCKHAELASIFAVRGREHSLKSALYEEYLQKSLLNISTLLFVWYLFSYLVIKYSKMTHGFSCCFVAILTGFQRSTDCSREMHKQRKVEHSQIYIEKFIITTQLLKSCS